MDKLNVWVELLNNLHKSKFTNHIQCLKKHYQGLAVRNNTTKKHIFQKLFLNV